MDLNIRNMPPDVLKAVKVSAASQGVTLRQFVLDAVGVKLSGGVGKASLEIPATMPRLEAGKPVVGEPVGVTEDYGVGKAPESVRKPKLAETDEPLNIGARYKAFMEAKRGKT